MLLHTPHLLNAFLLAVVLVMLLKRGARAVGLVDVPNARKMHEGSIPVIGGVAMFAATLLAMLLLDRSLWAPWEFIVGLSILVLLGVIDDRYDIGPRIKFAAQSIAALVMIVPSRNVIGNVLGNGGLELHALAVPFTVIFVVGLINAFNMMDGLDGLAGGAAASAFFWLAVIAAGAGQPHQTVLLMLFCATLGFLVFNMRHPWCRRATVFMGDAGSMMLGAGVAFFMIVLTSGPEAAPFPALLWICAIPAIDTLSLIVRRIRADQSPLAADRRHLHHLLLDAGLPPASTTVLIVGASFALGAAGAAGAYLEVPDAVMVGGLALAFAIHTAFVCRRGTRPAVARRISNPPIPTAPGILSGHPIKDGNA